MAKLIIKEIAKSRGINQSQLQLKAGVSAQLLNRYWNNHTRSVALDQIERIAKALGVRPGELLVPDEEMQSEDTDKRLALNLVAPALSLKQKPWLAGEDKKGNL